MISDLTPAEVRTLDLIARAGALAPNKGQGGTFYRLAALGLVTVAFSRPGRGRQHRTFFRLTDYGQAHLPAQEAAE